MSATDDIGYVVHRRPYRESSLLLDLLTRESGFVAGIFKGAKRRKGVMVEPFTQYRASWVGRSDLVTVTELEPLRLHHLKGRQTYCGLYLNELIYRSIRHGEQVVGSFEAYVRALDELSATATVVEPTLRRFEKALLKDVGYEIMFESDLQSGEAIQASRFYEFVEHAGFVQVAPAVRNAVSGEVLLRIAQDDYSTESTRRAAKQILRSALRLHIGEKPLRSRDLFIHAPSDDPPSKVAQI